MPKKNAFFMFMMERRPKLVEEGHEVSRGWCDVAQLVSEEWKEMGSDEKKRYVTKAERYNQAKTTPKVDSPQKAYTPIEPEMTELTKMQNANLAVVKHFFRDPNWRDTTIVVCDFTLYFERNKVAFYAPAEIGLSAFSLKKGMVDNFGRVIDMGAIPPGHGLEVLSNCDSFGIPVPGKIPEFAGYEELMFTINTFLVAYHGNFPGKDFYVFAFDSDFEMVTRCFDWLNANTGHPLERNVTVLSLNYYAHFASTIENFLPERTDVNAFPNKTSLLRHLSTLVQDTSIVSTHRTYGIPLHSTFTYNDTFPQAKRGWILNAKDVDDMIKEVDNYKYYIELCCVYHFKTGDAIHCALSNANRHVFSLLEILTLSNDIPIIPGAHFPQLDQYAEVERRFHWIFEWGLTTHEFDMEEPSHFFHLTQAPLPDPPQRDYERESPESGQEIGRPHLKFLEEEGAMKPETEKEEKFFWGQPRRSRNPRLDRYQLEQSPGGKQTCEDSDMATSSGATGSTRSSRSRLPDPSRGQRIQAGKRSRSSSERTKK